LENENLCIERIKERVKKGGHFVPNEDVIRRYRRSIDNFWNIYRFLADDWTLYYNSDEVPILVATGNNNAHQVTDNEYFKLLFS
jgi:predicted ABC-type ATPase